MLDYDSLLSERVKVVKPSGIRKFFDYAATMQDVISLGVGEPDFETPWQIRRAGIQSLEKGRPFTPPTGAWLTCAAKLPDSYSEGTACPTARIKKF